MPSCTICTTPLSGGIDTFGEGYCINCWLALAEDHIAMKLHAEECLKNFNKAYAAKDWDKADFWYHERWAPITDSPAGLVTRGFVSARKEAPRA